MDQLEEVSERKQVRPCPLRRTFAGPSCRLLITQSYGISEGNTLSSSVEQLGQIDVEGASGLSGRGG